MFQFLFFNIFGGLEKDRFDFVVDDLLADVS